MVYGQTRVVLLLFIFSHYVGCITNTLPTGFFLQKINSGYGSSFKNSNRNEPLAIKIELKTRFESKIISMMGLKVLLSCNMLAIIIKQL